MAVLCISWFCYLMDIVMGGTLGRLPYVSVKCVTPL